MNKNIPEFFNKGNNWFQNISCNDWRRVFNSGTKSIKRDSIEPNVGCEFGAGCVFNLASDIFIGDFFVLAFDSLVFLGFFFFGTFLFLIFLIFLGFLGFLTEDEEDEEVVVLWRVRLPRLAMSWSQLSLLLWRRRGDERRL